MDLKADLVAPCTPAELFAWVHDLETYPRWLDIVTRAVRAEEDGSGPAWQVDLRGRLGPLARSKRLRMVRSRHEPDAAVTFEREELDGRQHSVWKLATEVGPDAGGARLQMTLHYGGSLFGPVLERVLRDEIERSRTRLLDLVTAGEHPGR